MTFDKAWAFQQAVFTALEVALPGIEGFSFQPDSAPERFWRIDGFSILPIEDYKDTEAAQHSVTVHLIDTPDGGTNSLSWVKQKMAVAATALTGFKLDDVSNGLRPETGDARFEAGKDGTMGAHAFIRFAARINA